MNRIALLLIFIAGSVFAADIPSYLEGGTVTVTLKSGKTYSFQSDEFKVVPRVQAAPSMDEVRAHEGLVSFDPPPRRLNTIKLYGGYGAQGVKSAAAPTSIIVSQDFKFVFGLGISRQLTEEYSVEAVGLSNGTGLLGLGYSF
jgi:hypothetical protein